MSGLTVSPSRVFVLCAALGAVAAASLLPLLHHAANRLVVGTPLYADLLGADRIAIVIALALGGLTALLRGRLAATAGTLCLAGALLLFAHALGTASAELMAGQPTASRARLASGSWLALLLGGAALVVLAQRIRPAWVGWLAIAVVPIGLIALGRADTFDALSLAVEYRARRESLHAAVLQHVALCGAALALALVATFALAVWRRARGLIDLAVDGVQVVPAVALFGALVAVASSLLSALPALRDVGLSALGPGPAIVGVAAYLLLPLRRGLQAALNAPDPATLDAATALGLTPRQILGRVRLPIGAPILVGALRVASVQSIGLATLGALVGAGGLGQIVFDGMAQFAPDLILLGAIPVIALSLVSDRLLSAVEAAARRRWRG